MKGLRLQPSAALQKSLYLQSHLFASSLIAMRALLNQWLLREAAQSQWLPGNNVQRMQAVLTENHMALYACLLTALNPAQPTITRFLPRMRTAPHKAQQSVSNLCKSQCLAEASRTHESGFMLSCPSTAICPVMYTSCPTISCQQTLTARRVMRTISQLVEGRAPLPGMLLVCLKHCIILHQEQAVSTADTVETCHHA